MDSANSSWTKEERLQRRRERERTRCAAKTGRRGWQLRLMSKDAPEWREWEQLSGRDWQLRLLKRERPGNSMTETGTVSALFKQKCQAVRDKY